MADGGAHCGNLAIKDAIFIHLGHILWIFVVVPLFSTKMVLGVGFGMVLGVGFGLVLGWFWSFKALRNKGDVHGFSLPGWLRLSGGVGPVLHPFQVGYSNLPGSWL